MRHRCGGFVLNARDAEVEHSHEFAAFAADLDEYVVGLEIAMDDAVRVGLSERREDLIGCFAR